MVRLVFRPYTQIRPSICTSERLRASTRVSSAFALFRHSSPSFGSQRLCSAPTTWCRHCRKDVSSCPLLSLRTWVSHPNTCTPVGLLGPCFKTGRSGPFCLCGAASVPEQGECLHTCFARLSTHTATRQLKKLHSQVTTPSHTPQIASLATISHTFHSLFKVLFIFPSRYFFAIGLLPVFSLRWNLPPSLSCIPKQLDSLRPEQKYHDTPRDCHPLRCSFPEDSRTVPLPSCRATIQIIT